MTRNAGVSIDSESPCRERNHFIDGLSIGTKNKFLLKPRAEARGNQYLMFGLSMPPVLTRGLGLKTAACQADHVFRQYNNMTRNAGIPIKVRAQDDG